MKARLAPKLTTGYWIRCKHCLNGIAFATDDGTYDCINCGREHDFNGNLIIPQEENYNTKQVARKRGLRI